MSAQPNLSNPSKQNSNNIIQFFGSDFSKKCEKAKNFGPVFNKIKAKAGVDAAMSAWLLVIVGDVDF